MLLLESITQQHSNNKIARSLASFPFASLGVDGQQNLFYEFGSDLKNTAEY